MRTVSAHSSCCYLTENKEHSLVQLCTVLDAMDYRLMRDDVHRLADLLVNKNVNQHEHVPISKHVTEGLLMWHSNLIKIVAATSLDPKSMACYGRNKKCNVL